MNERMRMWSGEVWNARGLSLGRRVSLAVVSLVLASAVWLPAAHFFFTPGLDDYMVAHGIAPRTRALAERHLAMWTDPALKAEELRRMRVSNAEWDFMGRTFLVLALANMGLREPARKTEYLAVMDRIIEETLAIEEKEGVYFFLMPYARSGKYATDPPRSMFIDGEIALMIGARRVLEEREEYKSLLRERVETMIAYMRTSRVLGGESYPDECWTFCNCLALASIRIHDFLGGTDHSDFLGEWLDTAKRKLIEPETGLLVSSFSRNGTCFDGPEGSTIWMVAHCLQLVDADFARDQYARARKHLAKNLLGFAFAREWPEIGTYKPFVDIDSGPIVPILEASAGSSGMAFLGARAFGDDEFLRKLLASLHLAGFPLEKDGRLRFCASNQVGDAVLLYAMVMGPVWEKVMEERR